VTDSLDEALADPIGLIVRLVSTVEHGLDDARIREVVVQVAGGRAKRRRLAHPLGLSAGADERRATCRVVGGTTSACAASQWRNLDSRSTLREMRTDPDLNDQPAWIPALLAMPGYGPDLRRLRRAAAS
jgi:hypothetical protein